MAVPWVDMGGGTGSNLEYIAESVPKLKKAYVVDLAGSLLDVASKRMQDHGWTNAEAVEADATTWTPPEGQADVVHLLLFAHDDSRLVCRD